MIRKLVKARLDAAINKVIQWWKAGGAREFPWRRSRTPWAILVAEILLIQTDAAKASQAYSAFISRFASPKELAAASESEVTEVLRPIGLYRQRAKRLKKIASIICSKYGGEVPKCFEKLKALPGVGDYIAAAVCLFAFGKPAPLLDVNTSRVLSRIVYGRDPPKRYMYDEKLRETAEYVSWSPEVAYALIDFASAVCLPKKPQCRECVAGEYCAYRARWR